ncbi:MAG: hypothetical protein Q8Q36_03125 [bacterium]|nr:hypothetical protein [bacterium]
MKPFPYAPSKKTFHKGGKWIEKPSKTQVFACSCGAKYIVTREPQASCIKCMYKKGT